MNLRLVLGALWLALALLVIAQRWQVTSEVPALLESREHAQLAELSRRMAIGPTARTLVLVLSAEHPDAAFGAARELAAELGARAEIERASLGPPGDALAALEALYFPRRFAFADAQAQQLASASEAELRVAARALRAALAGPEAASLSHYATRDPLRLFPAQLARIEAAREGALETRGGQWATPGGAAVLLLRTRASPFDLAEQRPLLDALDTARARLEARHVRVELSGVHRFAALAQQTAQRDAQRISALSLALVVGLFLLLFGSLRALAASLLQLALSLATATAVCLLVFGGLHTLTVAFGATLIGVSIDYPIHLAHHHALAGDPRGPLATLRGVAPALLVGAATSIAGFAGFAVSDAPGLRELGVFGFVGLVSGLASLWVIAPMLPRTLAPTRAQVALAALLSRGYGQLRAHRAWARAAVAFLAAAAVLGALRTTFSDDVFALNLRPRADWLAEEARVQAQLGASERARFVAVFGASDDEALRELEALAPRLEAAIARGALASFESLAPLLRTEAAQAASERAFRGAAGFGDRLARAFEAERFAPGAFAPFVAELEHEAPPPLHASDLSGTPLEDALGAHRVPLETGVALVVTLRGVSDLDALQRQLAGTPNAVLVDQRALSAELYARYRAQLVPLLGLGVALVALALALRFRSVRVVAAAGLPALLAAGAVLATLAALGQPATLLHLFGLLLVLCFAEDYGVFLAEARRSADLSASLTSIAAAAATSVLAFGLLAFSVFPALAALGLSVGVGTLAALLTSPLCAAALLPRNAAG